MQDLDVKIYKCFSHRMIDRYVRTPYTNNEHHALWVCVCVFACLRLTKYTFNSLEMLPTRNRRHDEEEKEFHMGH